MIVDAADCSFAYKPAHDKTSHKTCVTSKGSDQPVHPPSMAKSLFILFG